MKRKILTVLMVVFIVNDGFAAESKIMQTIQQFLPTPTEIGFLTGIINCYIQISQFVRTTNQLVNNVQNAKQQWDRLTDQITYMYETVQSLKNVDPYDMDSWQRCVMQSELLLSGDLQEAASLFNNVECYLADSTIAAISNLETPQMYKNFCERNQLKVDKYYLSDTYKNALQIYNTVKIEEIRSSIILIDAQMNTILGEKTVSELSGSDFESYNMLRIIKNQLEEKLNDPLQRSNVETTKIDTIIDESRQLISVNLSEIALAESRIEKMEEATTELIAAYDNIVQGNVSTHRIEDTKDVTLKLPKDTMYGDHPNKVPDPIAPENIKSALTNKKETNQQDAVALQNQISYTLYKQDCLYRDIQAMKVNVMAFVVAIETLEYYKLEQQAFCSSAQSGRRYDEVRKK